MIERASKTDTKIIVASDLHLEKEKEIKGPRLFVGYLGIFLLVIGFLVLLPLVMLIFYPGQWVVFGLSLIFTALAWWRHRANIKRLMNGTENKFEKKKR